ncbi:UbiA family prenyltransferase [Microbispora corallina]|uniref:Transferase n=1 Tax=Microbispora corallina TaxID=83302 RepID=A0ABQ4G6E0_9ACTN|nr:UbiA family prenyltransferase [Microbispora corallina]GIH42643.1 transferase [Microbispora corallina]
MTAPRDLFDLVRAPAALSVPGDVVAGAAAGGALGRRTAGLACSSICLYWAGMAANDWADRHLDAVERPERPIPSGRVSANQALGTAAALTVAGLAVAGLTGGRRALTVAAPLAAAIWAYDLAAKSTPAGPLTMALCRGLDVLLGATPGSSAVAALPSALTIAAHTYLLTALSHGEVSGTDPRLPAATLAGTVALTAATVRGSAGAAQPALAGWYAAQFGLPQARAVADPSAMRVREAVNAGIVGLPALQGALAARGGAPRVALALAAVVPLARRLVRKISAT